MIIEKNGKNYRVEEFNSKWNLSLEYEKLSVTFSVLKEDCSTFNDLKEFVLSDKTF